MNTTGCRYGTVRWAAAWLFLGAALSFAGDQRPYHGSLQQIGLRPMTLAEASSFEFIDDVIESLGPPQLMQWMILDNINNVGGKSVSENAQIFYLGATSALMFEMSTVTVANGDQIFLTVEGIYDYATASSHGVITVLGGTGRFERAEGSGEFTQFTLSDGTAAVAFDGSISTVGRPN